MTHADTDTDTDTGTDTGGGAALAATGARAGDAGRLRGRFDGGVHPALDRINRSFAFDRRMWRQDIRASKAHATMLGATGVLPAASVSAILSGLDQVAEEFRSGSFVDQPGDEDIHMAVERRLAELIGEDGKRLHAGRSRNDQVATDLLLYLRDALTELRAGVAGVQSALVSVAEEQGAALLPFYTHLQRAQPVLLGHVLLGHVEMLEHDRRELDRGPGLCPLGSGAGVGTTFPLDREMTARELGFDGPAPNSLAATASRQEAAACAAAMAACAVTLSRLGADIVLWTSREFGFARLGDAVSTGSSIMPQKRNPDGAELLRAKASRVIAAHGRLLELQRGLSLGYHKDLQEDKPALFEAEDTLHEMLAVAEAMLHDIHFDAATMRAAVEDPTGHLLATEAADWLVGRGVAFRDAHAAVGKLVRLADERGVGLVALPDDVLASAHPALGPAVRAVLDPDAAAARRQTHGGTAPDNVAAELKRWRERLGPAVPGPSA